MRAAREAGVAVGASVLYLPTYSPELNPIELWWADVKRQLRMLGINLVGELGRAVRRLRTSPPLAKIEAWFRHSRARAQIK